MYHYISLPLPLSLCGYLILRGGHYGWVQFESSQKDLSISKWRGEWRVECQWGESGEGRERRGRSVERGSALRCARGEEHERNAHVSDGTFTKRWVPGWFWPHPVWASSGRFFPASRSFPGGHDTVESRSLGRSPGQAWRTATSCSERVRQRSCAASNDSDLEKLLTERAVRGATRRIWFLMHIHCNNRVM